jgi:hypothetical protein
MARNTLLLVCILACITALIVGIRIGRLANVEEQVVDTLSRMLTITPSPIPSPSAAATRSMLPYSNEACGISLHYPSTFVRMDTASESGNTLFIDSENKSAFLLLCQDAIPSAQNPMNLKTIQISGASPDIATISALLYEEAKEGNAEHTQNVRFRHPVREKDILLSGKGSAIQSVIESLTLIQ